jgi:hypothetical protein
MIVLLEFIKFPLFFLGVSLFCFIDSLLTFFFLFFFLIFFFVVYLYLLFKKYFFKFDWSRLGFSHLFLYYPFSFSEFEWTLLSRQGPNELFTMGRHTYSLSNAFLARKKLMKCKCEVQGKNWSDNHALGEKESKNHICKS